MIRVADLHDLDGLVNIENKSFEIDRFSRRTFRYLLSKANSHTVVDERDGKLAGYLMLLFQTGTSMARVYSLAVDPDWQGHGIAKELMATAEKIALDRGCITLRLEVRFDNAPAIALYNRIGYRLIGESEDYYEDHAKALRYEKRLSPDIRASLAKVPYYQQTLDFTCGPAALLMSMHALDPEIQLTRQLELRLWRESTTIFMTSGHGGCGPYGLALAAYHRGFEVELYTTYGALFVDSVRSEEKKEVMRLVQEDFVSELEDSSVRVHYETLNVAGMQEVWEKGAIPIVLISSYRIYHEKFPHWVVVTGFDEKYVYVHDPYVDEEAGKTPLECMNMPIAKQDFEHMARYGKAAQKAAVVIKPKRNRGPLP